ncbi:hypothetical protein [Aeromicrobium sp. Root495]|nr:hypothetical protein [Aeromicrobium sp. Root495]
MSDLIRNCPECGQHTAIRLGEGQGLALYSCVACDAEFTESEPESDRADE